MKTTKRRVAPNTKAKNKARALLNYVTSGSVDDQVVMELAIELAETVLGSKSQ